MNEWTEYELRSIDDYERRCEICGTDKNVQQEISAIMLKKSFEEAQKEAKVRYEQGKKKGEGMAAVVFYGKW